MVVGNLEKVQRPQRDRPQFYSQQPLLCNLNRLVYCHRKDTLFLKTYAAISGFFTNSQMLTWWHYLKDPSSDNYLPAFSTRTGGGSNGQILKKCDQEDTYPVIFRKHWFLVSVCKRVFWLLDPRSRLVFTLKFWRELSNIPTTTWDLW